jgi:hypothetical protein
LGTLTAAGTIGIWLQDPTGGRLITGRPTIVATPEHLTTPITFLPATPGERHAAVGPSDGRGSVQ